MLSEAAIIHQLQTAFPSHIGDDAASLNFHANKTVLVTKDILAENKHFQIETNDAASLAHKALHVNLSDLAAMGATPLYILCGIAIPERLADYAKTFLSALIDACLAANVILVGGDTTASDNDLFISITAIGEANPAFIKHRSNAKPGDIICMIGHLGLAHLGFLAINKNQKNFESAKEAFLKPMAKTKEGIWLAQHACVTAMIDLSDGLYIDLKRLCHASHVQGVLALEQFPITPDFQIQCDALRIDALNTQLGGGEDYGLLFTVNPNHLDELAAHYEALFHEPIVQLGHLQEGKDLLLLHHGKEKKPDFTPFTHFGESP